MPPKVLKRCSLCKNFHAAYLVDDPRLGKLRLCYACWSARQAAVKGEQNLHQVLADENNLPEPKCKTAGGLDGDGRPENVL